MDKQLRLVTVYLKRKGLLTRRLLLGGWLPGKKWRTVLLFCVSLLTTLTVWASIPAWSTWAQLEPVPPSDETIIAQVSSSPRDLLQLGITHYTNEQFTEAIQAWNVAAQDFEQQGDRLGHALALSNISSAYQQLGKLSEAEPTITTSLQLIADSLDSSAPSDTVLQSEIAAKVWNTSGSLHWRRGQLEHAIDHWQTAQTYYDQAGDITGGAIALINQAKALQSLGLSHQAEAQLRHAYQRVQHQPDNTLRAESLLNLARVLRQVGDLETAAMVLNEALTAVPAPLLKSQILLEFGHTERVRGDRQTTIGKLNQAEASYQTALDYYQQALALNPSPQFRLSLVQFLSQRGQWADAEREWHIAFADLPQHPNDRAKLYTTLHLVERRLELNQNQQTSNLSDSRLNESLLDQSSLDQSSLDQSSLDQSLLEQSLLEMVQLLNQASQHAQVFDDSRLESYILGELGAVYQVAKQWQDAQWLTQHALLKLEGLDAPDLRYRWEWQLGQLQLQQGDRSSALASYTAAVASLQAVRNNLLSINPDLQFSFRDNVEPVYREFLELLLVNAADTTPTPQRLQQAIQVVDQLQVAELENYLGCAITNITDIQTLSDANSDSKAAILYPIVLSDRLVTITRFPGANPSERSLTYHQSFVAKETADQVFQSLRVNLAQPGKTPDVIANAQQLYQWLIQPLDQTLAQSTVNTLVFVLDGPLRNLPMSVLFDGKQYLIEKGYAVAIAPRLDLFRPSQTPQELHVKLGGVGIAQKIETVEFPAIAKLEEELDRIAQYVDATPPLLNESFTIDNIQSQLQQETVSAIHWKTHGVFSSDPFESYIVGHNQRINTLALNTLLQTSSLAGNRPLELLVLSSCETAQGDNRAVLGLAGLATRTGVRSVLSTLWTALDTPNTEFMVQFYKTLTEQNTTKAEAVRQAQLSLINDYGYTTPYIWANYLLVGNWL